MSSSVKVQVNQGEGDPIVVLHGLGNNYKSWTYVIEHFDYSKNRLIAVDLLGFGDSEKPDTTEYTPKDHADAIIKALDEIDVKGAVVAGHSMGCIVAIEIARQRPDLVSKLVLLGAPLFKRMPSKYARFKFWQKEDLYSKLFRIIAAQKDMTLTIANGVVQFLPLIKGMEITEETWPAFKKSLRNTIMQTETFKTLSKLEIETLLIYGHLDLFVIKKNLKGAARRNKKFITFKTALGPHEITPVHGKTIAELLQSQ